MMWFTLFFHGLSRLRQPFGAYRTAEPSSDPFIKVARRLGPPCIFTGLMFPDLIKRLNGGLEGSVAQLVRAHA